MICNKCGQEMPEVGAFCPFCGEPKPEEEKIDSLPADEILEEKEPRKLKPWQLIAIIVGGVLVLAILAGAVWYGLGALGNGQVGLQKAQMLEKEQQVANVYIYKLNAATGENSVLTGESDIKAKTTYTAFDEDVAVRADNVVATLGTETLTLAELQLYYTNDLYSFMNQYYNYLGAVGLDLSLPLDEQVCPLTEDERTWQQYFLEMALSSWQSYALLENLMARDGYLPSEAMQLQLDSMEDTVLAVAQNYGYEDVQTYLESEMTPGITLETYLDFNNAYYMGNEYLDQQYAKIQPTAEEIESYYQENEQVFADSGIAPGMGLQSSVRHILIQPEGGTTDENNQVTYSEEELAAAYAEAERILEEWKAGEATEESFAQLANTYSKDGGSNTTGGLYEGINKDASYVEEFRAWAVDANRQKGDVGIVQTQFGYHIMFFVSGEDYFTYVVGQQLIAQRIQQMLQEGQEQYPAEINYKSILLYTPVFS